MRANSIDLATLNAILKRSGEKFGSEPEEEFAFQCRAHKLPAFEREVRFAEERFGKGWRFDFAWQRYYVALEVEGIVQKFKSGTLYSEGRHATVKGFEQDAIKYAHAAILGWHVLRFTPSQVRDGTAIDLTMRVLRSKGW